jgi:transcriptional regulator with XRE-family HTH domain
MNKIFKNIGQRLIAKRKQNGLTQQKLAEMTDLNKNYVGNIERGEKHVTIATLNKIAVALNCSMDYFFNDSE